MNSKLLKDDRLLFNAVLILIMLYIRVNCSFSPTACIRIETASVQGWDFTENWFGGETPSKRKPADRKGSVLLTKQSEHTTGSRPSLTVPVLKNAAQRTFSSPAIALTGIGGNSGGSGSNANACTSVSSSSLKGRRASRGSTGPMVRLKAAFLVLDILPIEHYQPLSNVCEFE